MADKPKRTPMLATVLETGRLTPRMIRIVLGGDGLAGFSAGEFTDHYVKVQFPARGAGYDAPFDVDELRETLPRELWPRTRSLTVRSWDPAAGRLTLDFVDHGDSGVAGPWAASAQPGDAIQLLGPGGAYAPDPDADWHLMAGDESVLPAIAASLERVPPGVPVHVIAEVEDAADELVLETPGDLRVEWLHRSEHRGHDGLLLEAVRALDFPGGRVHAFVHGEATAVREVRRHLVVDRGVALEQLSASGYWKRERSDEDWRAEKPEWKRLAEQDVAGAVASVD